MNIIPAHNLACPIDGARLEARDKQRVCENGHSFDVARQGYVNLLPVQHKRTKHPGDSKAMVRARTEFLNGDYYQPVAQTLADLVEAQIADLQQAKPADICLLDAGCGEGYYLDYVFRQLQRSAGDSDLSFVGLDISRPAIVEAAKRNRQISWIVGTNRQPPLLPGSIDIIVCVFGFQSFEGFERVLKPGGRIILLEPGPEHLTELRTIIYAEVKKTPPPALAPADAVGLSLLDQQSLQFKIRIDTNAQINNLLLMTPHFFRAAKAGREAATQLDSLELSIDIVYRCLQKK